MTDRPLPGDRVRHKNNDHIGTVLSLRAVEWPSCIDPERWVYVRFDYGVHNYFPINDLRPQRGCRDFAGHPDTGDAT